MGTGNLNEEFLKTIVMWCINAQVFLLTLQEGALLAADMEYRIAEEAELQGHVQREAERVRMATAARQAKAEIAAATAAMHKQTEALSAAARDQLADMHATLRAFGLPEPANGAAQVCIGVPVPTASLCHILQAHKKSTSLRHVGANAATGRHSLCLLTIVWITLQYYCSTAAMIVS